MQVIVSDTPQTATAAVVGVVLQRRRHAPTLVLLSGGSWLPVYDAIAEEAFSSNHTYMMADERFSSDEKVNNYSQLRATAWWERARANGCEIIDTSIRSEETYEAYGARFAAALAAWQTAHPTGAVIALLGLGEDGHTAGIFPGTDLAHLENKAETGLVLLPEGSTTHRYRVSVSSHFLVSRVKCAIFYAVGAGKCARLQSVLAGYSYDPTEPARVIHLLPEVSLITDCSVPK